MISRVNIYFEDDKLRRNLEAYSQKHGKSFSETVLEFTAAGFSLFQKTGSLNIDLIMEKVDRLGKAKEEIHFLRKLVEANLLGKPGGGTNNSFLSDEEKGKGSSPASVEQELRDDQKPKISKVLGKPVRASLGLPHRGGLKNQDK